VRDPLVFLGVITLLTITPGADMAMVSRSVFMGGRRAAFATTLGIGAGCLIWALASAAGVAAVLAASETAYDTLRLVGAAYLVLLGIRALRHRNDELTERVGTGTNTTRAYRRGLVTNLLNPKIGVFYMSLLPQFVPDGASMLWTSLLLALLAAGALTAAAQAARGRLLALAASTPS
jgi:threonine/homoserine/homoserine lactone efflux protein